MPPALAYLITWTTYGTWLSGDERGSVLKRGTHASPYAAPSRGLQRSDRDRLKGSPVVLDSPRRACTRDAIERHCEHRRWRLHAVNVRTNHVHVVVTADAPPERVMSQLKVWATRSLREAGLTDRETKTWTRHGSTRYLTSATSVNGAIGYVRDGQGAELE